MNKITLYHNSHRLEYRSPFGAVTCNATVSFSLDITGLPPDCEAFMRIWFQDTGETVIPLEIIKETELAQESGEYGSSGFVRRYAASYQMPDIPGLVWYYFMVTSFGITRYYGNNALNRGGVGEEAFSPPPSYQITVYESQPVPKWWKEGIVYQVIVDRFARGADWKERFLNSVEDGDRSGPTRLLQAEWRDTPFLYKDDRGWVVRWPFFGGTLEGLRDNLLYIKSLGVTIIYLNPIFEAASNHKYDTGDYHKIDPGYGDEETFRSLAKDAAKLGISIILDGVFSHTGADSIYFNRYGNYGEEGAWMDKDSPYRSWYRFNNGPEGYECWWGVADLPNVEEEDSSYQEFICRGEDSVIRHWLKAGARGWRLDVADELPDSFIKNIRKAVKETDAEGIILGEVWEDASNKRSYGIMREYLLGKELDATMNYPFREWALDFALNHISPAEVHSRVMSIYENYPHEYFYSCMNLLSSHDRIRVLSVLGEAPDEEGLTEWQKQSYRLNDDMKDLAKRRLKLLSLWQMTFPGVPSILYGDEAGVEGYSDPYNRGPFPWGHEDKDLTNWYNIIGNLRSEYQVLRNGGFASYGGYQNIYAYSRDNEYERILIFLNASWGNSENVTISVYSGENVFLELLSGSILEPEKSDSNESIHITVGPLECMAVYIKKENLELLSMNNQRRAAGVLCHITSLHSDYGCGDLGDPAHVFCDWLESANQKIWQILPLTPAGAGNSPYSGCSAFAGNEILLDLKSLARAGLLNESELPKQGIATQVFQHILPGKKNRTDFEKAHSIKYPLFVKAYSVFDKNDPEYIEFCTNNEYWLPDYCLYRALLEHFNNAPWQEWPEIIRDRRPDALYEFRKTLKENMGFHSFLQYQFDIQWRKLKAYARSKNIRILGDMPLFVAGDSCDAWVNRDLFLLDERGYPLKTGGCPPDAYTEDGQNWKTPMFDWGACKSEGWSWWINRFKRNLGFFDFLRLDHFRGYDACWEIPGTDDTAKNGVWLKGPGKELFEAVSAELGAMPFLAEDLGVITSNVNNLRNTFQWPGMKVYQFHEHLMRLKSREEFLSKTAAESDAENCAESLDEDEISGNGHPYSYAERTGSDVSPPANGRKPSISNFLQVYYTGTHDNDTLLGWILESIHEKNKKDRYEGPFLTAEHNEDRHFTSLGRHERELLEAKSKCREIIESLYASDAMWVILPIQDVLFLDSSARMNTPGTIENNWIWALSGNSCTSESALFLKELVMFYKR